MQWGHVVFVARAQGGTGVDEESCARKGLGLAGQKQRRADLCVLNADLCARCEEGCDAILGIKLASKVQRGLLAL